MGIGAVLNQEQRPVAFASRALSSEERNYTVIERECLAVVWALNNFKTYLGSLPVQVITDHAALTRLKQMNSGERVFSANSNALATSTFLSPSSTDSITFYFSEIVKHLYLLKEDMSFLSCDKLTLR
ncbi:hypothetical protein TNCV_3319441 [Trichonephila clavipes]|nr:hypothetical protein TNCV_3319441 [Trichonephila clavipes]